jgi:hypothetical protein
MPSGKLTAYPFIMRTSLIATFLFMGYVNSSVAQERKINIAFAGPSLIALPYLAAQEWKLFSQNGLSAQLIAMTFTISIPALRRAGGLSGRSRAGHC